MNTKFTKGEWFIERYHTMLDVSVVGKGSICTVDTDHVMDECMIDPTPEQVANAHLIAAAPDMYAMVESLSHELNMAIDEINTMRDIHHTDNLTPADHWDKESLHDAQLTLAKARGEIT